MEQSEIDSFVFKFRHLCRSGRNATLTLRSSAGKASIDLHVDLGDQQHIPVQQRQHSRDGPARQRRRLKRAAARRDAAEQAANGLSPEEAFILIQAEEAANRTKAEEAKELAKSKAEKALTKPAEGAESGKIEEPSTEAAEAKDSETAIEKVDEVSDELCPDKDYN